MKAALALGLLLFISTNAHSYNFAPYLFNSNPTTQPEKLALLGDSLRSRYSGPVHEELTNRAERYAKGEILTAQDVPFTEYDTNSLIIGARWNDDPLRIVPPITRDKLIELNGYFKRASEASDNKEVIGVRYNPFARSHFGDLQFLHSMANIDGEKASDVRKRILLWAEFTYSIAIGKTDVRAHLQTTPMKQYFAPRKCSCSYNPTCVNTLFDPRCEFEKYNKNAMEDKKIHIEEIALGSLLHMVQDSFSRSHVNRNPEGRIVDFYSYKNQDHKAHAIEDKMPSLITGCTSPTANAVCASADIVRLYLKHKETKVDNSAALRTYVEELYALADKTELSGPGAYISADHPIPFDDHSQ